MSSRSFMRSGRKPVVGRPPRAAPARSWNTGGKRDTRLKLTVPFVPAEITKRLAAVGASCPVFSVTA
jgi:hypothetical protein